MALTNPQKQAIINSVFADIETVFFRRYVEEVAIQIYRNGEPEAKAKTNMLRAQVRRRATRIMA